MTALDEVFVPNSVRHDPAGGFRSREDYKRHLLSLQAALPGQLTIEDLVAEGDQVVVRLTFRGTNTGDIVTPMPLPATGKQVTMTGISIVSCVGGKAVEVWAQGIVSARSNNSP